jgi:hypothetical protein
MERRCIAQREQLPSNHKALTQQALFHLGGEVGEGIALP